MRQKLADIRRELGRTGTVEDRQAYRALLTVRGQVAQRYQAAIDWLRQSGREDDARRFELMQGALPPVQTEKQLIAAALLAKALRARRTSDREQGRER